MKDNIMKKRVCSTELCKNMVNGCKTFLGSQYTRTILVFLCFIMMIFCTVLIYRLYSGLDKRISVEIERNTRDLAILENHLTILGNQTPIDEKNILTVLEEHLLEQKIIMEERLLEQTSIMEQNLHTAINASTGAIQQYNTSAVAAQQYTGSSGVTQQYTSIYDVSYQDVFEVQSLGTLDRLYREGVLAEYRKEAVEAFTAGRYVAANQIYREIATVYPEDFEARFYQYYALFLSNKQNQDNYRVIIEAMTLLERQGYTRREINETLEYIAAETGFNRE